MGHKLYLAPLRGFTDALYRNTFSKHFGGFDYAVAPFIATMGLKKIKPVHLKDVLPENNNGIPVIPQILGNNSEDFIILAQRLYELGYDEINWNLGCPHNKVARKTKGSGLLCHPDKIDQMLGDVIPNIKSRLSVKIRLGRHTSDELFTLLPILNNHDLSQVIIHPRTGVQMYEGTTDLDMFEKGLEILNHPVVYNGDVNTFEFFTELSERFGNIDGWMLGRGALANPFLPGEIKAGKKTSVDRVKAVKEFHDDLVENYRQKLSGERHLLDRMKGFWLYMAQSFEDHKKITKKIKKAATLEQYKELIDTFFANEARWNQDGYDLRKNA
jgi:tRNA-dihydrouridine synthase